MTTRTSKYFLSWLIMTLGLGLAAFAIISLTPSPAPAAPKITWNPSSLTQTILAGDSVVVAVSFTASEYLSDVVVRVVPELQPYVQVNPSVFAGITAGETVSVDVSISAPVTSFPGMFDGTIQLRSGENPIKNYARPLPVMVDILWEVFTDPIDKYQITYEPDFEVREFQSTRTSFISGRLFFLPGDMPNFAISVYENPGSLPVEDWYFSTIANQEYSFPDPTGRTVNQAMVAGVPSMEVRSNVLGHIKLRTFVPRDDKVFGLETSIPDDVEVPEWYSIMVNTFSFQE